MHLPSLAVTNCNWHPKKKTHFERAIRVERFYLGSLNKSIVVKKLSLLEGSCLRNLNCLVDALERLRNASTENLNMYFLDRINLRYITSSSQTDVTLFPTVNLVFV